MSANTLLNTFELRFRTTDTLPCIARGLADAGALSVRARAARERLDALGDLPEEAHAWEADVDELAADNDEVTGYLAQLESSHDAEAPEHASGDEIAREFERYLRRRDRS